MSSPGSFLAERKRVVPKLHHPCASDLQRSPKGSDIRLLVANEHLLFRASLRAVLDASSRCQVVGDSGDLSATLQLANEHRPDILLLGWQMSQQDDMRILRELAEFPHSLRIILVGVERHCATVVRAIQLGVRGILSIDTNCDELFDAIRKVMEGQYVLGQAAVDSLIHVATSPAPRSAFQKARQKFGITRREFDVISAVVAGFAIFAFASHSPPLVEERTYVRLRSLAKTLCLAKLQSVARNGPVLCPESARCGTQV